MIKEKKLRLQNVVTLGGKEKITYLIEHSPSASLQYAAILSRIFYCNNVNIAKISSEDYNVSNDDKSLHEAATAISEAAWSPWLVVSLLSLLVFPDLSKKTMVTHKNKS